MPREDLLRRFMEIRLSGRLYGSLDALGQLGALDIKATARVFDEVAGARFKMAEDRLADARRLATASPRAAVCASYYAMYHAARAALLAVAREDIDAKGDVESQIGKHLSKDLGEQLVVQRRLRNMAEYETFPRLPAEPSSLARKSAKLAEKFVAACRRRAGP